MSAIDSFIPDECAACGKGSDGLKKCSACKQVKYCNAICQKAHRSKHKIECRKRATELHDEALFKQPPPREDCPICFLPVPIKPGSSIYNACCGKTLCSGCSMGNILASGQVLCPFCRTPESHFEEDEIKRLNKRMAANDAEAFVVLGEFYRHGRMGLQEDHQRAFDLWNRSAELGSVNGHYSLGVSYYNGISTPKDVKRAMHHWEIAAMGGDVNARHELGMYELDVENTKRAGKHLIIAAKDGCDDSLQNIQRGYALGFVTKGEFEETLRAHKDTLDEMKSDNRIKAAAGLDICMQRTLQR